MQLYRDYTIHPFVPPELISTYSTLQYALSTAPGLRMPPQSAEWARAPIGAIPTQIYYTPQEFGLRAGSAEGQHAGVGQYLASAPSKGQVMEPSTDGFIVADHIIANPPQCGGRTKVSKADRGMSPYEREYEARKDTRSESGANKPRTTARKSSNPSKRVANKNVRFEEDDSANAIACSSGPAVEHKGDAHKVREPSVPNARDFRASPNLLSGDGPSTSPTPQPSSPDSCTYQFPQPPIPVQDTAGLLHKCGTLGALVMDIKGPRRETTEKPTKEVPLGRRGVIVSDIRGPPSNEVRERAIEVAQNKAVRTARTQLRKEQEKALRMSGTRVRRTRKKVGRGRGASLSMENGDEGGEINI